MTCPSCGAPWRAGTKFCEECGARLDATCPACGAAVTPGKKFCGACGARLTAPAPGGDGRFAAPSGYTPRHLAEQILKDRSALQGERKQVTVLFADVSGFTSISERLDPEEVHGLMNRAFERMLAAIHRYEGTVNQFLGDGLMALFGAPVAHEDHAGRAALAALDMQRALADFRAELAPRGIDFGVRMGLNTGMVVVGAIGDNLRMDYTAVGDTTNVAARMQQLAEPGRIAVADATRRLIEPHFDLRALGPAALKNRREPVAAWELVRARRAAAPRPLTPLLAREDALAALERALAAAQGGRGQVVYVVGEAGMGKSRLLLELRRLTGEDATWLEGRCLSFGHSMVLLPVVDALRQRFGIADTDGEAEAVDKVVKGLAPLGPRAAERAPYLRYALALDPGDPVVAGMDPAERRARLFQAIHDLVLLESRDRPIVLVVEDLHWIDPASEDFLKVLVNGVAGSAVLLVLTYRPTYTAPFGEHTYVTRVVLQPLDDADARALVRATLAIDDLPGELAVLIARKAEGNPFFLEEIGRALVDTGAVRREDGRLVLAAPASAITVPDRVQDVIAARIDRLGEDQKRTVQVASVIGREFALRLLRRAADAADRVERALADLKSLEFVYEKIAPLDIEYVFKHALTQDVAYESILLARRRELHARIGAAIEELYPDRLDERAEELAHHFSRGEMWDRAARYARQAGDRAAALCVDDRAVEFYERALDALARLPETPDTAPAGIEVRLALRAPLWRAGRLQRLMEIFREAEALATRHGETDKLAVVYAFFVQYYWARGEQDQAIAYGERCLEIAARRQDLGLEVTALYYLGHAYESLGDNRRAVDCLERCIAALEGGRETERFGLSGLPYAGACAYAAWCRSQMGDRDAAHELLGRGQRAADAAGHLYSQMPLAFARGEVLLEEGKVAEALAALEPAAAICREKKFAGQSMLVLTALGYAYALAGRPEAAVAAVREALEIKAASAAPVMQAFHLWRLAQIHLLGGQLAEAEAAAREAIGFAERHRERGNEAWARWALGEVARRRGDGAEAVAQLEAARAIAEELELRPLAARCRASLDALAAPGPGP
jgi:class 3 adenylate cyclase/tetratricopeptide (TPR) repeat protein